MYKVIKPRHRVSLLLASTKKDEMIRKKVRPVFRNKSLSSSSWKAEDFGLIGIRDVGLWARIPGSGLDPDPSGFRLYPRSGLEMAKTAATACLGTAVYRQGQLEDLSLRRLELKLISSHLPKSCSTVRQIRRPREHAGGGHKVDNLRGIRP